MKHSTDINAIIDSYAAIGHHRTGTEEDSLTRAWMCQQLELLGLEIRLIKYEFSQYSPDWHCQINNQPIVSIPLYYSAYGNYQFENIKPQPLLLDDWQESNTIESIKKCIESSRSLGDPVAVLATQSANNQVYAINVSSKSDFGFPVLLTGKMNHSKEDQASGYLKVDPVRGQSANIIASRDLSEKPDLILTTPFSGWFSCAAERAAGITVVLELIKRIGSRYKLQIISTSGHELHHLGTEKLQQAIDIDPVIPVLHIGSCVGVSNANLVLSTNYPLNENAELISGVTRLDTELKQRNLKDVDNWPGEAQNWVNMQRRVISLVGVNQCFHTPADTSEQIDMRPFNQIVDTLELAVYDLLGPTSASGLNQP